MMEKYDVILCDVPWSYNDKAQAGNRGAECKYPCIKIDELKKLDLSSVAADEASLFMWSTGPMMLSCAELMSHWGFRYVTVAFVWVKKTVNGKLHTGLGHTTRSNAEYVLLGRKGKRALRREDASVHQIVLTEVGKHSSKPEAVQTRIERLYGPDVRRLELFARRERPGWTCVGLDLGIDIFEFLPKRKNT